MYTQRMFDMWNSVTSKLEAHANTLGQSNVQSPGQNNSSGSIKGKPKFSLINIFKYRTRKVLKKMLKVE